LDNDRSTPLPPPQIKEVSAFKDNTFSTVFKMFLISEARVRGGGASFCQLSTILFAFIFEYAGGHSRLSTVCINGSVKIAKRFRGLIV
jgi:hypothetical protein